MRAHARLARAVLGGHLKECSWEALKGVYFGGTTDRACIQEMVRWANEHGVVLVPERRRVKSGANVREHYVVKFKLRPAR